MVLIAGASERTIEALKKHGARAKKVEIGKHAVTFNEGEQLPETKESKGEK